MIFIKFGIKNKTEKKNYSLIDRKTSETCTIIFFLWYTCRTDFAATQHFCISIRLFLLPDRLPNPFFCLGPLSCLNLATKFIAAS